MNLDGNHKVHQTAHNSWTLGIYNLTGRRNPYSVYYVSENAVVNGYKLSIFGNPIPFINFNIKHRYFNAKRWFRFLKSILLPKKRLI